MENKRINIEWGKIINVKFSHIDDDGIVYQYIIFFNDENIIESVLDSENSVPYINFLYNWAFKLNVPFSVVNDAFWDYISIGDSYEKFISIIHALNEERIKKEKQNDELIKRIFDDRKAEEEKRKMLEKEDRENMKKLEEEKRKAKLKLMEDAEKRRVEQEKKAKMKALSVEDIVGVCRFEFFTVDSSEKGKKVLDIVKVNFLICDIYQFEDIRKIQKEILQEVSKRLSENFRFKKYQIPIGCFKAKMFFKDVPKSISIIFTLKDELKV